MKRLLVLAILAVGCASDGDGGGGDEENELPLDPATCPDPPFEHCIVHDNGWDVWCENGIVYANDMTAHSYCYPGTSDIACTTGGESISIQHTCATTCATDQRIYFDFSGDYINFDKSSLCTP